MDKRLLVGGLERSLKIIRDGWWVDQYFFSGLFGSSWLWRSQLEWSTDQTAKSKLIVIPNIIVMFCVAHWVPKQQVGHWIVLSTQLIPMSNWLSATSMHGNESFWELPEDLQQRNLHFWGGTPTHPKPWSLWTPAFHHPWHLCAQPNEAPVAVRWLELDGFFSAVDHKLGLYMLGSAVWWQLVHAGWRSLVVGRGNGFTLGALPMIQRSTRLIDRITNRQFFVEGAWLSKYQPSTAIAVLVAVLKMYQRP